MLINRNGGVQCNVLEYIDTIFSDSLNTTTIEIKYYGKCINYEKNACGQNNDYYFLQKPIKPILCLFCRTAKYCSS